MGDDFPFVTSGPNKMGLHNAEQKLLGQEAIVKYNSILSRLREAVGEIEKESSDKMVGDDNTNSKDVPVGDMWRGLGMNHSLDILKSHIPEAFEEDR